jgi:hypothetical protein
MRLGRTVETKNIVDMPEMEEVTVASIEENMIVEQRQESRLASRR